MKTSKKGEYWKKLQQKRKRTNRWMVLLAYFTFMIVPISLFLKYSSISNYQNQLLFLTLLVTIGIMIGYLIVHFVYPKIKIRSKFHFIVVCVFFITGLGTGLNSSFTIKSNRQNYELIKIDFSGSKTFRYYLVIKDRKNKMEKIRVSSDYFHHVQNQDSVNLILNTGLLGFNYYEENYAKRRRL